MAGREPRELRGNVLLRVKRQERQVEHDGEPVAVDDKKEGQEGVDSGFGDDVGVETVAEVDRVDVVAMVEKNFRSAWSIEDGADYESQPLA